MTCSSASTPLLRNFPVIGHARYLLEAIGPELRQYLVAGNNEERPFTRDQRRWVYASAKKENNYFGFGTDNDLEYTAGYPVINHKHLRPRRAALAPGVGDGRRRCPRAKVLGAARGRAQAFRPGVGRQHLGDELRLAVRRRRSRRSTAAPRWPAACRTPARAACRSTTGTAASWSSRSGRRTSAAATSSGRFDLDRLKDLVAGAPVRALEIKLSQGAKPGLGGVLPAAKVSAEIAAARGVPEGVDCISPSRHAEFSDTDSLLDWVELLAAETGLPVGIKSAVGDMRFWGELTELMAAHRPRASTS